MGWTHPLRTLPNGCTLRHSRNKPAESVNSRNYPLMNFSPTSEYYIDPHQPYGWYTLMRFLSLRRMLESEAHFPWVCLAQYVPLTGFLNLTAVYFIQIYTSLISCWIRPWDFTLQSFFLLRSCSTFRYPMPFWYYHNFSGCPEKPFPARLIHILDVYLASNIPKNVRCATKTFQIIVIR